MGGVLRGKLDGVRDELTASRVCEMDGGGEKSWAIERDLIKTKSGMRKKKL